MWWPIRYQLLVPFGAILLIAVAVTSISSAWLAARRSAEMTVAQLNRVIETLAQSRFPFSQNVLEQMHGFSGAEFAAYDAQGRLLAGTLPEEQLSADPIARIDQRGPIASWAEASAITLDGRRYFASVVTRLNPSTHADTLLVLYPEARWQQLRSDAVLPPLLVGAITLGLMVVVSAWLAGRMSRRIRTLKEQVAAIANGEFRELSLDSRRDEIQELARSVNQMSQQLRDLNQTIRHTEQTRLLGQLAGGLAHQLRNAITGARLAVQIHLRRCPPIESDDSLQVALRQLELTEEQVRALLSLGKRERRPVVPRPVNQLVEEIARLIGPASGHADITFQHAVIIPPDHDGETVIVPNSESVRTAVLNLALNAIEAAGPRGRVKLQAVCSARQVAFEVWDSGPGPPPELGEHIYDAFITGKPEGVGFGLALAHQVAKDHHGSLTWHREEHHTCFRLLLPLHPEVADSPQVSPV